MKRLAAADIKSFLGTAARLMLENKEKLAGLDAEIGDGDLGLTMSKGFGSVAQELAELEEVDVGKILVKSGMIMASSVPSTMGTLMATGLMRAGKAVQGKTSLGLEDVAAMMEAFVRGITDRGKANPGDKTVVDALWPAAEALRKSADSGQALEMAMSAAVAAAQAGLEATKNMIAQHGKAACFQEKTLGKADPGASAGLLLVMALAESVK